MVIQQSAPTNGPAKGKSQVELDRKVPRSVRGVRESSDSRASFGITRLSKGFEVQTDTSDFVIKEVLMQDGHHIVFKCRKLINTKQRYTVEEKEMTTIVYCFRTW